MSNYPPPPSWEEPTGGSGQPPEGGAPPPTPGGGYPPPPSGSPYPPPPPSWQQPPGSYYGGQTSPAPGGQLAGWWLRVGATIVDGLVLAIPNFILRYAGAGGSLLALVVDAAYITLMLGSRGQTVGNMAVHTRVVDSQTGGPISYGKALGRWASELLLVILLLIPWILSILWPLWDANNQTLHDKMAGTVVLRDE